MTPTAPEEIDRAIARLHERKDCWARTSDRDRAGLVRRVLERTAAIAPEMVRVACDAKRIAFDAPVAADEWLAGPYAIVRHLRALLGDLEARGAKRESSLPAAAFRNRDDGGAVVDLFPLGLAERLLFPGTRAELRMAPPLAGEGPGPFRPRRREGEVALVLSAGNVSSIGPLDLLQSLFVEDRVAIVKMHPVNDHLRPLLEAAFAPLVEEGFVRFVSGGVEVGSYLVDHPGVEALHLTGSGATHDAIVWGASPSERQANRDAGRPRRRIPITSELGCVTPVLVVPGRWSDDELDFQARHLATAVAVNASCNCNAAKLLVTWRHWPLRSLLLDRVRAHLAMVAPRFPFYPGSESKYDRFLAAHPGAQLLGTRRPDELPPAVIFDVDPDGRDDVVFREEAWSPILAETALDARDEGEFLDVARRFVDEVVEGTLSITILAAPSSRRRLGPRFDDLLGALRYGTVSVNHWSAFGYAIGTLPWGAFPGHTLAAPGSGIGRVHNPWRLERGEKTVVWGPFRPRPTPPWFHGHRRAHDVARRMVAFEGDRSWGRLPGIGWQALRGV